MKWKPMKDAPRNGATILALIRDASGVDAIRWGVFLQDRTREGWFDTSWTEAGDDDSYRGWIEPPDTPEWVPPSDSEQ